MWKYNYTDSDYLQHRLVDGRRVKYVAKVPLGGDKFRYFYTMPEYQAYLNGNKKKTSTPTVKKNLPSLNKQTSAKTTTQTVKKEPSTATKQISSTKPNLPSVATKTKSSTSPAPKTTPSTTKAAPAPVSGKDLRPASKSSSSVTTKNNDSKKSVVDKLKDSVRDIDPTVKDVANTAAKAAKFLAGGRYGSDSILSNVVDAVGEKLREGQQFETLDELPKSSKQRSADQDQDLINPDYDSTQMRYSMNCSYCSATWDLRRRGYEVEARPFTNEYDTDLEEIASWYRNTGTEDFRGYDVSTASNVDRAASIQTLGEDMLSQGEGAYGNFVMYWTGGAGHSVVWSVENGKLLIRDTQLDTVDTWEDYMKKHEPYMDIYCYLRTDNREINANILEVCRERRVW